MPWNSALHTTVAHILYFFRIFFFTVFIYFFLKMFWSLSGVLIRKCSHLFPCFHFIFNLNIVILACLDQESRCCFKRQQSRTISGICEQKTTSAPSSNTAGIHWYSVCWGQYLLKSTFLGWICHKGLTRSVIFQRLLQNAAEKCSRIWRTHFVRPFQHSVSPLFLWLSSVTITVWE